MKKILFVSSALGGGGAERVLSILANYFHGKGYDVKIVSLISPRMEYSINSNISCVYVGGGKNKVHKILGRLYRLKKEINDFNAEVIISFGWAINIFTILASVGTRRSIIISERNDPKLVPGNKVLKYIRNILYKKVSYMVFQTEEAKKYFKFANNKNSCIIANPILDGLPNYDYENNDKYILAIGRLHPQKNFTLLIKSFAKFLAINPDYKLTIVGDGPEKRKLLDTAEGLHISDKVNIIPFSKDIHDYLQKCSMYISSSNFEGISNSMLESLAIGVPTICTDCPVGGARMFIENNVNGILTPVEDEKSLLKAMVFMAADRDKANKMGKTASLIKYDLSVNAIGQKWIEIVEMVGVEYGQNEN